MKRALTGLALLAAAALVLAVAGGAAVLPGGTSIDAAITSHHDGEVIPAGSTTITANGSVGTGVAVANTTLVYIVDVSGSTGAPTNQSNCPRQNVYDAASDTTLDCELLAIRNLNNSAVGLHTVAQVAMIGFAGNPNGFDDSPTGITSAFALDLDPATGQQSLVAPNLNDFSNPGLATAFTPQTNLDWVVQSAYLASLTGPAPVNWPARGPFDGFTAFTPRDVGTATNYAAALIALRNLLPSITTPHIQAVMVSDGDATAGVSGQSVASILNTLVAPAGKTLTVDTFAIGAQGTCGLAVPDSQGSLLQIAAHYGRPCIKISDPGQATSILPGVIASKLTSLRITVDTFSTSAPSTPALPINGPGSATATASNILLQPGQHSLCAIADGTDGGGAGSSGPQCVTVTAKNPPVVTLDGGGSGGGTTAEGSPFHASATVSDATSSEWTASGGTGTCTFVDPHALATDVTCTDDGDYTLTLTAQDNATPVQTTTATEHLHVNNVVPAVQLTLTPPAVPLSAPIVNAHLDIADPGADVWTCTIDWGDGSPVSTVITSSRSCDIGHPYSSAGTFSVHAVVGDGDGGSGAADGSVTVQGPPTITGLPTDGPGGAAGSVPEGAPFGVHAATANAVSTHWDASGGTGTCTFGDASALTTSVTCTDDGLYAITLTAVDSFGQHSESTFHLDVTNVDPNATMTGLPSLVALNNALVHAHVSMTDPGADQWSCTFDWGDGTSTPTPPTSTPACDADHTYTSAGSFHVTVQVSDGDGGHGADAGDVHVQGPPAITGLPTDGANGAPAATVNEGSLYTITGSVPSGTTIHWTGGAGHCAFTNDAAIPTGVRCDDNGIYELTVTATDTFNQVATGSFHLQVNNVPPTLTISNPGAGGSARSVVFNAIVTDPGTADVLTCTINWGDGGPAETVPVIGGFCNATHTYADSVATATLTATASDDDGGVSTPQTRSLSFNRAPVCIDVRASETTLWPANHQLVLVTLSGATDADGDTLAYTVTGVRQDEPLLGTGSGDTSPDARLAAGGSVWLRAERAGTGDGRVYTVSFRVEDPNGGACTGSLQVTVVHDQAHGAVKTPGVNVNSLG